MSTEEPTGRKCKCGGNIFVRGMSGYARHGIEMEAEWEECDKCGATDNDTTPTDLPHLERQKKG